MKASYNLWLAGLSVAVAMAAAYVAIALARAMCRSAAPAARNGWLAGAAAAMGAGVWATHFTAMTALRLPVPLSYDSGLTAASFGLAFLGALGAFLLARRAFEGRGRLLPGALFMAAGVVAMHYTGLYAMRMDPPVGYDPAWAALSAAVSLAASYAALWLAFRAPEFLDSPGWRLGSAAAMGAAISGMHYLSMAGARFAEHARSQNLPMQFTPSDLGLAASSAAFLVICLGLLLSIAKPLFSLWRLAALILLGEFAIMVLLDHTLARGGDSDWLRDAVDGVLLVLVLSPLLWRLRRDNASLAYERARAAATLASIGEGVIVVDAAGRVEYLNGVAKALTGWDLAEAQGRPLDEVYRVADGGPRTLARRDGARFGVEDSTAPIPGEQGRAAGAVLVFRDVTARRQAEDELKLAATVFSHAVEGIIITDQDGVILRVNQAFCAITGYAAAEVVGRNPRILSSGRHDRRFYQAMWQRLHAAGEWQGEVWNRRKDGEIYPEWLRVRAIQGEDGGKTHFVGIFSDISERVRDQQHIFRLAYYDSLTGLANRALLLDHLEIAVSQAHRRRSAVAVLFIDMDRFKLVNDSLGHSAGDALLQGVAQALAGCVREGDTVSRLGGDEFVVCLPDLAGAPAEAARDALALAEKIQRRLSQPFSLQGHEVAVTPSIGVALYPADGDTPGALIKHADIAMYHAKAQGRDNVQLFSQALLSVGGERLGIQSALRRALDNHEFSVHYQAQVDLSSGRIVGAEALLRWRSGELGWIPPARFIPVAEDTSLILPLGEWLLRQVCRDLQAWQARFGVVGLPRVALNFSPRQFIQPDFVARIVREREACGLGAQCLEVEITEATLMHNTELALGALRALRACGVRVAVDDFGVGYSSLSYLTKFPIDVLKIDQSFIRDLAAGGGGASIVRAIIAMGRSLGLTVLAEGVETEAQMDFLRAEGCQEAQGFFFSLPVPADEFAELLRRGGLA